MWPDELARHMAEEHEKEVAYKRELALAAARMARRTKAEERAVQKASIRYCLHPVDDPWSRRCRTLCGRVRDAGLVLSPKAVARAVVMEQQGCAVCTATLAAWKLFGNGKPLTYRRLNKWLTEEAVMGGIAAGATKTKRELAYEKALVTLTGEEKLVEGKVVRAPLAAGVLAMDEVYRTLAVEMLIGLIALETARRERGAQDGDGEAVARETLRRRAWHVELTRLKLPSEVLRALRGL